MVPVEVKKKVKTLIPYEPSGMTMRKLTEEIGASERTVRRAIAELKGEGYRIVNKIDGKGFYMEVSR